MATIDNLGRSITEMDKAERLSLIIERRTKRRLQAKTVKSKGTSKSKPAVAQNIDIQTLFDRLSTEQQQKILDKLGGSDSG